MLADRVEHYVNVARDVGQVLRERNETQAAQLVEGLAERSRGVAQYLRGNDGAQMWNDAQELARDRTWLLAGIGFLGGLAAARTVRTGASSGQREYVDSYAQPQAERYR